MADSPQDEIMPLPQIKRMLSMAQTKPLGCAFGLTKDKKECLLLIDKSAKGKKVATMLKTGGKAALDPGTMRFGKVGFDAENDPETVRFTMNRAEAGGTITTLLRLAKKAGYKGIVINTDSKLEDEADEQEAEETPQAPPPAPPLPQAALADASALKARITDLVKRMIPRVAAEPARKDELTALAKQAQLMLGTNNLKSATAAADELEAILDSPAKPQAAAAASPPPAQASPAPQAAREPQAAAPGSEQAEKTLRELIKLMPASIAANPSLKDELLQLAGAANAKLKAGLPAEAAASIEALGKLIGNASVTADDVRQRLDEVRGQASRLPESAKSELQGRVSRILAELGSTNPAKLAGEIDTLENDLARATTAARTAEAAAASGDTVSYRRLQSDWVAAQARARKQLDQFVKQVLADKEIQDHPRFADIREGLDDAVDQLPDFGNALEGSLAAIDDAANDAARKAARAAAVKVLEGYHAALNDADSLRALQAVSDDDYGGLAFYAELQNTLESLGKQLEKGA